MRQVLRRIVPVLLVLTLVLALCGCDPAFPTEEDPAVALGVVTVLDGIVNNDPDASYSAFHSSISREAFDAIFSQLRDVLKNIKRYELNRTSYSGFDNGSGMRIKHNYWIVSGQREFRLEVETIQDSAVGITHFSVTPKEKTSAYYTGTWDTMKEANWLQWAVLLLSFVNGIFVVCVAVDCYRNAPKDKILWILVILLGSLMLWVTNSGGFLFSVKLGCNVFLDQLVLFGDGSFKLILMLPVGAVAYLLDRSRLIAQREKQEEITWPPNPEDRGYD